MLVITSWITDPVTVVSIGPQSNFATVAPGSGLGLDSGHSTTPTGSFTASDALVITPSSPRRVAGWISPAVVPDWQVYSASSSLSKKYSRSRFAAPFSSSSQPVKNVSTLVTAFVPEYLPVPDTPVHSTFGCSFFSPNAVSRTTASSSSDASLIASSHSPLVFFCFFVLFGGFGFVAFLLGAIFGGVFAVPRSFFRDVPVFAFFRFVLFVFVFFGFFPVFDSVAFVRYSAFALPVGGAELDTRCRREAGFFRPRYPFVLGCFFAGGVLGTAVVGVAATFEPCPRFFAAPEFLVVRPMRSTPAPRSR